jgi:hypothetical protein
MPEISAFDRALLTPSRPPRPAPSLADLECCRNHPGHEGLAPAIEPDLPDGEVIDGRFVIREPVGRSDMATVYRAEDRSDGGRSVAIKIPLLRTESDPVLYGRFHREELIGVTLSHPNLLRFIKVSGEKSRPYIAMEYLDGCTLAYILHLARPLPERDSLRITAVVCEALEYLHGRGYIHRDLKPSNIMICRDCTLRLMDYGLAEELKARRSILDSMTPLFGTPEYMAPEQVRNARNTERTDIYSLGVVLYQMMTGVLPFPAQDPWVSAQMRVTGDPGCAARRQSPDLRAGGGDRAPRDAPQALGALPDDGGLPFRARRAGARPRDGPERAAEEAVLPPQPRGDAHPRRLPDRPRGPPCGRGDRLPGDPRGRGAPRGPRLLEGRRAAGGGGADAPGRWLFRRSCADWSMVPFSILDLSPIVEGGTAAQALARSLDLARHAEKWGYRRYWVAEHHNMPGIASAATAVVIGHVAAGTSTIRVGSGGIMLPEPRAARCGRAVRHA